MIPFLSRVKVRMLRAFSDIDPGYTNYPDEDEPVGHECYLEYGPWGVYLTDGGRVAFSQPLQEGVDYVIIGQPEPIQS